VCCFVQPFDTLLDYVFRDKFSQFQGVPLISARALMHLASRNDVNQLVPPPVPHGPASRRRPLRILFIHGVPGEVQQCLRELKRARCKVSADVVSTPEKFRFQIVFEFANNPRAISWRSSRSREQTEHDSEQRAAEASRASGLCVGIVTKRKGQEPEVQSASRRIFPSLASSTKPCTSFGFANGSLSFATTSSALLPKAICCVA
jgi:hypothetical protein